MYKIMCDGVLFCSSEIEEMSIDNPVITLEANKAGTFTFTLPPSHPKYDTIQQRLSIIDVFRDEDTEPIFEGICVEEQVDFYKQKKIICEGELTFLNDSTQRPYKYQNKTSRQLLEAYIANHNASVESKKHFTVGQVTAHDSNDSIYCFTNYNSTMQEIKEDLVDDIGGYLRTRHENGVRYLDYLASSPHTASQMVKLGYNLLDFSENFDTTNIATVVIPLGATLDTQTIEGLDERLTIKNAAADDYHPSGADYVYSQAAIDVSGKIEKVVTWDNVTTEAALLAKAEEYLTSTQWATLVLNVKAIDLGLTSAEFQKFRLLDMVRVVSVPHGLDSYFMLTKMTINLNNPESDSITLGKEQQLTLSAKTSKVQAELQKEITAQSGFLLSAIDNATALITGAEGGYVVIERNAQGQPTEIKIQDALSSPTKIWRWNQNGFGYSSDGGQTYGTAITMNGAIVADYVTAGTMTGDRIRGGELLVGGSGLAASGSITVKDSSNNTIGSWDSSGLEVKKGTIKGPNIEVGGYNNANGYLRVRDSLSNIVATLDDNGLYIYDTNGNAIGYFNKNGLYSAKGSLSGCSLHQSASDVNNGYLDIENAQISGGVTGENTGYLTWKYNINNVGYAMAIKSDHNLVFNAERILVGTNSGTVFWTENNQHMFSLPTQIENGVVRAWLVNEIFVNGLLIS